MTSFSWFSGNSAPSRKFMVSPCRKWSGGSVSSLLIRLRFELLEQDRPAEAHRVESLQTRELQDRGDFLPRRAGLERTLDVTANAGCVQMRAGCIERDADERARLLVQNPGDGGRDGHRDHLLGPRRVEFR